MRYPGPAIAFLAVAMLIMAVRGTIARQITRRTVTIAISLAIVPAPSIIVVLLVASFMMFIASLVSLSSIFIIPLLTLFFSSLSSFFLLPLFLLPIFLLSSFSLLPSFFLLPVFLLSFYVLFFPRLFLAPRALVLVTLSLADVVLDFSRGGSNFSSPSGPRIGKSRLAGRLVGRLVSQLIGRLGACNIRTVINIRAVIRGRPRGTRDKELACRTVQRDDRAARS